MKNITSILLILILAALALQAQQPPTFPRNNFIPRNNGAPPQNNGSPDNSGDNQLIPPGLIDFQGVDVSQVLEVYAQLVGRTLLRSTLPNAQVVLKTETPLTKAEAIQALQAVLSLNGIAVINVGDKFVKVLPTDQAGTGGGQFNDQDPSELPELGPYMTRIVQLKFVKPTIMAPILQPFGHPNSIIPIDDNGILVLRDDPENIKRMMEMIAKVDVVVPEEYISQVIPIKYAMADDIAGVLSSLESAGGGTVSFGSASTPSSSGSRNGIVGSTGTTGMSGSGGSGFQQGIQGGGSSFGQQGSSYGQQGTSSQGSSSSSPFANRLQSILNKVQGGGSGGAAGGANGQQQPIQVLGQAKIIADERSNSLLIYATRQDMDTITNIVGKLDVLLAQVLIESVIMEVDLNKSWNYGISVAQNPIQNGNVSTVGAINNGTPFYSFLSSVTSNSWPGSFTSTAPSGLSYFGDIGPNWDIALQAAASDSSTHIIQRPRIQTSQAKEADFFVGQSVPYVTSVYYDSGFGGGPSSSYSQLQVGISLDVTPFINPDGLVVMDINQQINDIAGFQTITGVGQVPTTDNRTFTSEVAVKDRDTIILGGFTDTETDKSSSGVPILQDIPLLGWLFKSPSSNKTRDELLVLMRPTVLRTPELAAIQAVKEEVRSPGISGAEREERAVVNQERKAEDLEQKRGGGVMIEPSADASYTNTVTGNPMGR
jgi:general secretion pathway protein D